MEAQGGVGGVREIFSGTRGKILIGGGLLLVGFLVWSRRRGGSLLGSPSDAGGAVTAVPGDRTRNPQSPPTVGNDTQSDAGGRPQDAEAWISQCVDILSNPPYNKSATAVYNALRRALDGEPITETERALVEDAIRVRGTPPGGMPALNIKAPADGGQANSGGGATTPPAGEPAAPAPAGEQWIEVGAGQNAYELAAEIGGGDIATGMAKMRALNPGFDSTLYWRPQADPSRQATEGNVPYFLTTHTIRVN